ncbi:MAG: hydrogen peroxide-inducible genes activator [Stellaceae bacterium]
MRPLPSLQQLRFLDALSEHRHFGRAAAACAVTQSTLSAGIQELEQRLGASLVERSRKQVLLTRLGEEIVARGRRLLREAEDIAELARSAAEPLSGPLRLGVIPTISPYLVPAIMRGLPKAFPKLKLFLREEQTAPLLQKLDSGQLDLVLLALPYEIGDAETFELGTDPLFVAMPPDHPLARGKRVAAEALGSENLLLMEDGHCLRSHSLQACRLAGPGRNEVLQGTSLRTVIQMAAGGLGLTLVPQMALGAELPADGSLIAKPLAADAPPRRIALAWRRSSARKAEFGRFGAYVKALLAACETANAPPSK